MNNENKEIYVNNIDGAKIIQAIEGRIKIQNKANLSVMPYSLESLYLRNLEGFEMEKIRGLNFSTDIINVKFEGKVNSDESEKKAINKLINSLNKEKEELEVRLEEVLKSIKELEKENKNLVNTKKIGYKKKQDKVKAELKKLRKEKANIALKIKDIENRIESKNNKLANLVETDLADMSSKEVRDLLYNGFELPLYRGDEVVSKKHYTYFGRSASKARVGECVFLNSDFVKSMENYSYMNMEIPKDKVIDVVGLMAYSSLVGSHITDTLTLAPENILLIDDVDSVFNVNANIVYTCEGGFGGLDVKQGITEIKNSLFDGQSLIDCNLIPSGKSSAQLRNHFFKTCSFKCNFALFFKDRFGESWKDVEIKDMFGNKIKLGDVKLITTPNSCKFLKFNTMLGISKAEMYDYWKEQVKLYGNIFGIVKYDKSSKYGNKQRMAYQHINSLRADEYDIAEMVKFELSYIGELKNNTKVFKEYLRENANDMNKFAMWADLGDIKGMRNCKEFLEYKRKEVGKYVDEKKKGKILVNGDYNILCGNPYSMLLHAIGELPVKDGVLGKDYTDLMFGKESKEYALINTMLFSDGEICAGFRNPHTSMENILLAKNVHSNLNKYFNFNRNIVCINSINTEISHILSGSDEDGDTMLLTNNSAVVRCARRSFRKDLVTVDTTKNKSNQWTFEDMNKIDNKMAESKMLIGEIVNTGQIAMSNYYNSEDDKVKARLEKLIHICNVLSGIAIDMAKREPEFNIKNVLKDVKKELNNICGKDSKMLPLFWTNVKTKDQYKESKVFKEKVKVEYVTYKTNDEGEDEEITKEKEITVGMDCPMDYLNKSLTLLPRANKISRKYELKDFLRSKEEMLEIGYKINRRNPTKEEEYLDEVKNVRTLLYALQNGKDEDIIAMFNYKKEAFLNKELSISTIWNILNVTLNNTMDSTVLNILYTYNKDKFMLCFKDME